MTRRSPWSLVLLCAFALSGCASALNVPTAGGQVDERIDAILRDWGFVLGQAPSGVVLASRAVGDSDSSPAASSDYLVVEALAWSGRAGTDDGATVLLRLTAHVEAAQGVNFEPDTPESDETRCVQFVVGAGGDRHDVDVRGVDCPADAQARTPVPDPGPQLPDDVEERTRQVLADPDEATLLERVQAAFPEDGLTISTGAEDGRLVVAIGTGAGGDCSVVVREPDGRVEVAGGFPREWLMAGETGCSAALVLAPPQ